MMHYFEDGACWVLSGSHDAILVFKPGVFYEQGTTFVVGGS
jgi:hypothetical protein